MKPWLYSKKNAETGLANPAYFGWMCCEFSALLARLGFNRRAVFA